MWSVTAFSYHFRLRVACVRYARRFVCLSHPRVCRGFGKRGSRASSARMPCASRTLLTAPPPPLIPPLETTRPSRTMSAKERTNCRAKGSTWLASGPWRRSASIKRMSGSMPSWRGRLASASGRRRVARWRISRTTLSGGGPAMPASNARITPRTSPPVARNAQSRSRSPSERTWRRRAVAVAGAAAAAAASASALNPRTQSSTHRSRQRLSWRSWTGPTSARPSRRWSPTTHHWYRWAPSGCTRSERGRS